MTEVPQNAGYMVAAYLIAALVLLVYGGSLWRRVRGAERRLGASISQGGGGAD